MLSTKNPTHTMLELINHSVVQHPDLAPHVESLALKIQGKDSARNIESLFRFTNTNAEQIISYMRRSNSQILQDIFVLAHFGFKRNGYFVEFGAANGKDISNTYLMEKEFGWRGIVAEPAVCWHEDLRRNRTCHVETSCVWKDSGSTLSFNETENAELATINTYSNSDLHRDSRSRGRIYDVSTISLTDLLIKYQAPTSIDYLSIDTEGSEYEILSNFDFSRFCFEVITCEHNFTPMRSNIYSLLTSKGYRRVFEDLSRFDDWYVRERLQ